MTNRILIFLLFFSFVIPISVTAQLSEDTIEELAETHANR